MTVIADNSVADYTAVIVPRTLWEFPQLILITASKLITSMSQVGPRRHRQTLFSSGPEPALGPAAGQSGCRGRALKPLAAGSCRAIESRSSFPGTALRLRRAAWKSQDRRGRDRQNQEGTRILSFPNSSVLSPKLHWLILNFDSLQVLSFSSHVRLWFSVAFCDLPNVTVRRSVLRPHGGAKFSSVCCCLLSTGCPVLPHRHAF